MSNHWTWYTTISSSINEPFVPNEDKFGFVYIITNTKTSKAYVGCKQYYLGKSKTQSKWQTYIGSSKYLKEDIKKIGKEHFTFEVIAEYKNKRSLRYYEAYYQMKWDVLTSTIEGSDEPAYYNSYVGGKWYRPIESYQQQSGENHYEYKGKAEFYLDGKRMVVDCLGFWADENGYDRGRLNQIARTNRDGFIKDKNEKNGKNRRFKMGGPLGTITKVRWLVDNE
jgi:hypothetical protein|tara:strand:- start:3594 stop:4265 length:672 start_codon:yes stop_codon:yes gene_type:complete